MSLFSACCICNWRDELKGIMEKFSADLAHIHRKNMVEHKRNATNEEQRPIGDFWFPVCTLKIFFNIFICMYTCGYYIETTSIYQTFLLSIKKRQKPFIVMSHQKKISPDTTNKVLTHSTRKVSSLCHKHIYSYCMVYIWYPYVK